MKKGVSQAASKKISEQVQFDKNVVDFSKFKPDLKENDFQKLLEPINNLVWWRFPIDTLSSAKTMGKGRTNITIINSTIVQVDAATPYASFDRRVSPSGNPIIQIHFDPAAYGITHTADYFIEFNIESSGQSTFNLAGFSLAGTLVNAGNKVLNGLSTVTLIIRNMPPTVTYAYLEQINGGAWTWYTTSITLSSFSD